MTLQKQDLPAFEAAADGEIEYRAVSALAAGALLAGLASPLAFLSPVLWIVPLAGMVLGVAALVQIAHRWPVLIGRKAALLALALSSLFAAAGVADWLQTRRWLCAEARQFADLWFEALRQGDAKKAHQLSMDIRHRQPLDERLAKYYAENPREAKALENFTRRPGVRQLLDLGPKARIRYVDIANQGQIDDRPWIELVYAVTADEASTAKPLLVKAGLERVRLDAQRVNWQFFGFEAEL